MVNVVVVFYQNEHELLLWYALLGTPMRFSFTNINITILDANDNSPVFIGAPYLVTVPEGDPSGGVLLLVTAFDADSTTNGRIAYSISGDIAPLLVIDSTTVSRTSPAALVKSNVSR